MPLQERNSEQIAMMVGDFWHREDDIAMQAFRDVIPDADGRGLWSRVINRGASGTSPGTSGGYADHFRSGVIPVGFAWAAAPFGGVPASLTWSWSGSYLGVSADAAARHFLYRTIGADGDHFLSGRFGGSAETTIGFRIDDGTDNNYVEILITPSTAGRTWDQEIKTRHRIGGGGVVTGGILGYIRSGELLSLYLRHFTPAPTYIVYVIPEFGRVLDGIDYGINFVASRIGLVYEGTGWQAWADWINWNFP